MKNVYFLMLVLGSLVINSCEKELESGSGVTGKWALAEVCQNDHWGAPFYWAESITKDSIELTSFGDYLRKSGTAGWKAMGKFRIVAKNKLEITSVEDPDNKITLSFKVKADQLILETGRYEGLIAESFDRVK
ncbi:hypothetical protein [Pedobacter sp. SYSU D00535]|uniref:hypothetical protein n=1 Tax=Pedobacter sp. SYSU D00535 TaxID=2810308 RepID=UPI001A97381B|nr:hypothetical protein [Pedobacter sp. SYSU D00535]